MTDWQTNRKDMQNWLADHKRTDWQIDCWLIDRQTDKEGDQLIDAQKVTWKNSLRWPIYIISSVE